MDAAKHDAGKIRVDLITPEMIYGLGEVLTAGAQKYPPRNWELGMPWTKIFGSAMRHLWTWYSRKDIDAEMRLSHLKCAMANIGFLITYEARHAGTDDRSCDTVLQDDGYYSRDRLVQRFDGVLDTFIFETRRDEPCVAGDVPDIRSSI